MTWWCRNLLHKTCDYMAKAGPCACHCHEGSRT